MNKDKLQKEKEKKLKEKILKSKNMGLINTENILMGVK